LRRTEEVPYGTDAITPTYARSIPSSRSFERSDAEHHRVKARHVPRGGVVNARRPGLRPGRSTAKSIDDVEHGASIKSAMVRGKIRTHERDLGSGNTDDAHESIAVRFVGRFVLANLGAKTVHAEARSSCTTSARRTATSGTTNDGVNDPVSTAWGHKRGRTAGSFTPSLVHRLRHRYRR
jgi:hypothetical protein